MDNQPAQSQDLNPEDLIREATGTVNSAGTMREFLDDYFTGSDLVTIKNILSVDTGWVFADPKKERIEQPDKSTRRVYHAQREAKVLKPGQTITVPGWQAFIALDRMWKQYAQIQGGNVGVAMTSPVEMVAFVDKAYMGIFDPNEQKVVKKPVVAAGAAPVADIDPLAVAQATDTDDLGFEDDAAPVTSKNTNK